MISFLVVSAKGLVIATNSHFAELLAIIIGVKFVY